MFEQAGRRFDWAEDGGDGSPILFVAGSFSTPSAWREMQSHLPSHYRMLATSICGYGATDDPRDLDAPDMRHEIDVVAAVADRIGDAVHLVGHSFGGTIALLSVLSGRVNAVSVTTFEANPFPILRTGPHAAMVDETRRMSAAFEAAWRDGEADAAGRIIDFWGGDGAFAAMPGPARDYCRRTCRANVIDWRLAHAMPELPDDYAGIGIPALLVRGSRAVPVMRRITATLAQAIPGARTAVVAGAGHFPIMTHPEASARLLAAFLESPGAPATVPGTDRPGCRG